MEVTEFKRSRWESGRDFDHTPSIVLAEGEITGHSHVLTSNSSEVELETFLGRQTGWTPRVLMLDIPEEGATLTHQEHDTVQVPEGKWISFQQREAWSSSNGIQTRRVYD